MNQILNNNYEVIYHDFFISFSAIKCKKCESIIFNHFDTVVDCPVCNNNVQSNYDYWTKDDIENNEMVKESYNNLVELIKEKNNKKTKQNEELENLIWHKYISIFDDEITLALTTKSNKHHLLSIIIPFKINKVIEIPLP